MTVPMMRGTVHQLYLPDRRGGQGGHVRPRHVWLRGGRHANATRIHASRSPGGIQARSGESGRTGVVVLAVR